MRCPGCQLDIDEATYRNCPFCAASLSTAPQARPGQIPMGAAPLPPGHPPGRTPYGTPSGTPPPLPGSPATVDGMERAERSVYRVLLGGAALVAVLAVVGAAALVRHYSRQQAAFEKEARFDLSTPESAAREAVNAVKGQAWARLYYICEFADTKVKLPTDAADFAKGFHKAEQNDPDGSRVFKEGWSSLSDIRIGRAVVHGDRADVPIDATAVIGGARRPTHGVAHLVNEDGSWRLDMTSVSIEKPTPASAEEFNKELMGLLVISQQGQQGASSAGPPDAAPPVSSAPHFGAPTGFGAPSPQTPPDNASADSYVTLQSDQGDYIGGGQSYRYTPANSRISVIASEGHLAIEITGKEQWRGDFCCPGGQLHTGTFSGLTRYGLGDPAAGGMEWTGEGRGSNALVGAFTISSVMSVGSALSSIDLRFEQHSESAAPALHGTIHWRLAR